MKEALLTFGAPFIPAARVFPPRQSIDRNPRAESADFRTSAPLPSGRFREKNIATSSEISLPSTAIASFWRDSGPFSLRQP